MGHYQKLEEFQITNKKIIDVSELLFSEYKKKVHQVIDKFDKICNPKLKYFFYKLKVESGHEPVYVTDDTKL